MSSDRKSLAERREQLLDAAVEVMASGGVKSATTRSITQHAGVPHGAFHYCFDSKHALMRALLEREIDRARSDEIADAERNKSLEAWLHRTLAARVRQAMEAPKRELVIAELGHLARTDPILAEHVRWEQERYTEAVRQALGSRAPTLDETTLRAMTDLIVVGVGGVVEAWLRDRDDARAIATVWMLAHACHRVAAES